MNINRLAWFWQVGSVASRFYGLESSPKGSILERFPTLSKKKKKTILSFCGGVLSVGCVVMVYVLVALLPLCN